MGGRKTKRGANLRVAIAPDGKVYLQPAKIDVRELSGMLYQASRKMVSVEEMERSRNSLETNPYKSRNLP